MPQVTCTVCKEVKPHHAKGKCRRCYFKFWRVRNPEKCQAWGRAWAKANPERHRILTRRSNAKHNHKRGWYPGRRAYFAFDDLRLWGTILERPRRIKGDPNGYEVKISWDSGEIEWAPTAGLTKR